MLILTEFIRVEVNDILFAAEMGYDRYKFVVQCVIGEQRGEGVKMGCRCFWDSDTDNYAQDVLLNVSCFHLPLVVFLFVIEIRE